MPENDKPTQIPFTAKMGYDWERAGKPLLPELSVGQEVWIYAGEVDAAGEPILSGGIIICKFRPEIATLDYFVIRLHNPEWPIFETRDALMITDKPDAPPLYVAARPTARGETPHDAILGSKWFHTIMAMRTARQSGEGSTS